MSEEPLWIDVKGDRGEILFKVSTLGLQFSDIKYSADFIQWALKVHQWWIGRLNEPEYFI